MNLTGFLHGKNARIFMQELWELLTSAQESIGGIPTKFLEQKKEEIRQKKVGREMVFEGGGREGEKRWGRRAVAEVSNSMYGRSGGHVAVVCALFMYTPVILVAPSTSFICAQCCLHIAITSDLFCSSSKLTKRKFYRRCFVFQVFSDVPCLPLGLTACTNPLLSPAW